MPYARVMPRDLFNEANLLKCIGRIYLNLETEPTATVLLEHDGGPFVIEQDSSTGDIYLANVHLKVNKKVYRLYRPLNSRGDWPLYLVDENDEEISVFDKEGSFTIEMTELLRRN